MGGHGLRAPALSFPDHAHPSAQRRRPWRPLSLRFLYSRRLVLPAPLPSPPRQTRSPLAHVPVQGPSGTALTPRARRRGKGRGRWGKAFHNPIIVSEPATRLIDERGGQETERARRAARDGRRAGRPPLRGRQWFVCRISPSLGGELQAPKGIHPARAPPSTAQDAQAPVKLKLTPDRVHPERPPAPAPRRPARRLRRHPDPLRHRLRRLRRSGPVCGHRHPG